jgi:hypothetical protein
MVGVRQYVEDCTRAASACRNWRPAVVHLANVAEARIGMGSAMRWIYDRFQSLSATRHIRYGHSVPKGSPFQGSA